LKKERREKREEEEGCLVGWEEGARCSDAGVEKRPLLLLVRF